MSSLWQALAVHAVARFAGTEVVGLDSDDTLFHKTGRKVNGAQLALCKARAARRICRRLCHAWC